MDKFVYTPTPFMLPTSRYSRALADHAVAFINQLCHTKGDYSRKPFDLIPWQEQIVRDVFGIVRKSDNKRQFRTVFAEIPKKQGKSELAAAIALYLLCADGEEGAEIYGCANDRSQAGNVFEVARDMVLLNPTLRRICKINESQKRIMFPPTRSYYQAMSAEVNNKFGLNVHGCIFDELLGQPDSKLYDVMTKGSGASRKQPLNFVITTAGEDRTSICWKEHSKAVDLLEGRKIDSTFYPVAYSAPDDADWTDEEVWKAVNPSIGYTVPLEFYQDTCASAKQDTAEEMYFRQYYLNQWIYSAKRWLPMDKYDKGADPIDMEALKGRDCFGGLDLASTDDIAAFVLVFPPDNTTDRYIVLPFFWIPGDNIPRRVKKHHVRYDEWARDGFLNTTEGNIIHYEFIEEKILELGKIYNIKNVAFDPWGATQMIQRLEGMGKIKYVEFHNGIKSLSPPSKELYRLVLDEKIQHGGQPVLRWMFNNVYVETDAAANIKPAKDKSYEKIDGAVATIMALSGAIHKPKKSVYDTPGRGIISFGADGFNDGFDW